jgi:hypothetical protein
LIRRGGIGSPVTLGLLLAIFIAGFVGAVSAGEFVRVENATHATQCAEEDNVYVKFLGAGIRHFVIEARLPDYFRKLDHDSTAPDFSRCDMSHDPSYAFEPKQLILYEDRYYRLVGHTFQSFWRQAGAEFHVGKTTTRDLHLVQLIRKVGGRPIEILVVYPSDGYWRVKPLPPPNAAETAFGSSFLVGPIEQAGRPLVAFSSIEFVPAELSFRLTSKQGTGRLRVVETSPGRTRLAIDLPTSGATTPFVALRSMFVSPAVADTAEVKLTTGNGRRTKTPILEFTAASARAVTFGRSLPSHHNASAPDLRFSDFTR